MTKRSPSPLTQETGVRFPVDSFLRRCGFRIESRPKSGQNLWRKDDKVMSELEAYEHAQALHKKAEQEKACDNNRPPSPDSGT